MGVKIMVAVVLYIFKVLIEIVLAAMNTNMYLSRKFYNKEPIEIRGNCCGCHDIFKRWPLCPW